MSIMADNALWEILEAEAEYSYYLWKPTETRFADKPAVIISMGFGLSPDHKRSEHATVWFGRGIEHWNCKNLKQATIKAEEILTKYPHPIKVVDRKGRLVKTIDKTSSINTKGTEESK